MGFKYCYILYVTFNFMDIVLCIRFCFLHSHTFVASSICGCGYCHSADAINFIHHYILRNCNCEFKSMMLTLSVLKTIATTVVRQLVISILQQT